MNVKTIITTKTISTFLVELVLLVVLGYSNATSLRAPIIVIAFGWTLVRRGIKIRFDRIYVMHFLWAVFFFLLVVISKTWAIVPQGIDDVKNNVLWCAMITIIMADYITFYEVTVEDLIKILIPVVIMFFITLLVLGTRDSENRLSISNNANSFGLAAAGMMSFFLYGNMKRDNSNILYHIFAVALMIAGLLSGSRKTMISIIIYFIGPYLFNERKNARKTLGRLVVIVVLMFAAYEMIMNVGVLYNTIGKRVEALLGFLFREEAADGSVASRMNMTALASNICKEHPILGIGANNFKYYTYYNTYSHNGYMEILCSFGIVGLIIYYFPILTMLISGYKSWKQTIEDAIFPICILVTFFLCEIGLVSYFDYQNYCFLGIAAGLIFNMKKQDVSSLEQE